jgi:hypothetical protein
MQLKMTLVVTPVLLLLRPPNVADAIMRAWYNNFVAGNFEDG